MKIITDVTDNISCFGEKSIFNNIWEKGGGLGVGCSIRHQEPLRHYTYWDKLNLVEQFTELTLMYGIRVCRFTDHCEYASWHFSTIGASMRWYNINVTFHGFCTENAALRAILHRSSLLSDVVDRKMSMTGIKCLEQYEQRLPIKLFSLSRVEMCPIISKLWSSNVFTLYSTWALISLPRFGTSCSSTQATAFLNFNSSFS